MNDETFKKECYNYVLRKNKELNMGLHDFDIQEVADLYEGEISEVVDRYVTDEFVENDLLLLDVAKEYLKGLDSEVIESMQEEMEDERYNKRFAQERAYNAHGGYGYNESFDDLGLDEEDAGLHL